MKHARLSPESAPARIESSLAAIVLMATIIMMISVYIAPLAWSSPYRIQREKEHTATREDASLVKPGTASLKALSGRDAVEAQRISTAEAGETLQINSSGIHVEKVSSSEIERRLAWIDGTLVLNGTLEQAVEEFNRYNFRQLVIDDTALRTLSVVGRYDAHNPDFFAADLRRSHHIEYVSLGGGSSSKEGTIHLKGRPISHTTRERAIISTRGSEMP
jgi:hypothetical protein